MSIEKIVLQNFKCFEYIEMNLSGITLLTGENSSGKSSLINAILGIFQSDFPLYFSTNGKYVDMGDFSEISFNYDRSKDIRVDISLGGNVEFETLWGYEQKTKMPFLNKLDAKLGIVGVEITRKNGLYQLNMRFKEDELKKSRPIIKKMVQGIYEILSDLMEKEEGASFKERLDAFKGFTNISNIRARTIERLGDALIEKGYELDAQLLKQLTGMVKTEGENINYIGSFRISPERIYNRKTKISEKVNKFGENCIDQILEWRDRKAKEYKELIEILRELKLLRGLMFRQSGGGRFEPRVRIQRGGVWSSLVDVGFGISQLLPVIVADLQMAEKSTLIVAQPEMHLHPSAQAELAEIFVKQVKEKGKRYILETHSEYLLNRIRALIVKGVIDSKEVSLYYFLNSEEGSKWYKIELTKNGQIKGAPEGFFETYQMEVLDIALNT